MTALATIVFKAAGGTTGIVWRPDEFSALSVSFYVAAGVSLLAALTSALRSAFDKKWSGKGGIADSVQPVVV